MEAVTSNNQLLQVGQLWHIAVLTDGVPSILVTDPSGDPVVPTVDPFDSNVWSVIVTDPGAWVASVTATDGAQHFRATVGDLVPLPSLADLRGDPDALPEPTPGYLRETSWEDSEIQDALDAETSAQARTCKVPPLYSTDLREALMRRVFINLKRRTLPALVVSVGADGGAATVPGRDPEVRRLESPYRRMHAG